MGRDSLEILGELSLFRLQSVDSVVESEDFEVEQAFEQGVHKVQSFDNRELLFHWVYLRDAERRIWFMI